MQKRNLWLEESLVPLLSASQIFKGFSKDQGKILHQKSQK